MKLSDAVGLCGLVCESAALPLGFLVHWSLGVAAFQLGAGLMLFAMLPGCQEDAE